MVIEEYIIQRLQEYPLSAKRIYREIQEKGFAGNYTIVKDFYAGRSWQFWKDYV